MLIKEIIKRIIEFHGRLADENNTRDLIIAGDIEQECSGIVVTITASYDVICQAIEKGCNFIITHESIFYGGRIDKKFLEKNEAYIKKKKLIEDNNIVIWRDHDHIHGSSKDSIDYIFHGIMDSLGWKDYIIEDEYRPLWYKIPKVKASKLADMFVKNFNLNGMRVVGDLDCEVETVWFAAHLMGEKEDGEKIYLAQKADCIIPLEICDYTLTQYVVDSCSQGNKKVILEMGHFNCEEIGIPYMKKWLPKIIDNCVPVIFMQAGDFFSYIKKEMD